VHGWLWETPRRRAEFRASLVGVGGLVSVCVCIGWPVPCFVLVGVALHPPCWCCPACCLYAGAVLGGCRPAHEDLLVFVVAAYATRMVGGGSWAAGNPLRPVPGFPSDRCWRRV